MQNLKAKKQVVFFFKFLNWVTQFFLLTLKIAWATKAHYAKITWYEMS